MTAVNTAFIGLGAMGYPMAGHLAAAGHRVAVYNRTRAKAENWLAEHKAEHNQGGEHRLAATPREAARGADWVMVCVGNDDDLRAVTMGPEGALAGLQAGACLIDHGTSSAAIARELAAACAAAGAAFLDAPMSGGQAGAEQGALTIFAGGPAETVEAARPVLDCYAGRVTHMGATGLGQTAKMVNQICVAGLLQGLSEGLAFGQKAGLDGEKLLAAVGRGAAQSWQMDNRGPTMLRGEFDFGFAAEWMHKDLGICLAEAERLGAALPVSEIIRGYYAELMAGGDGRLDTSALIKRLI